MTSEIVLTEDGSRTIRHPVLGETYHAVQGAASEAEVKFIRPTRLRERLETGPVRLLDIGFGLGINCRAALACSGTHPLSVDTLEREPEALDRALELEPDAPLLLDLKRIGRHRDVTLHLGDLRHLFPKLNGPYDVIFHDPFSPMKNSEAWTVEVFRRLRGLASEHAVLATYSESRIVRSALLEAGWQVGTTPAVAPHRGGTLATIRPEDLEHPLNPERFRTEPYRDPDLNLDATVIRSRREKTMRRT